MRLTAFTLFLLITSGLVIACSQTQGIIKPEVSWSHRIADSFINRHPDCVTYDSTSPAVKWNYEQGLMLVSLMELWRFSGDKKYFDFVQCNLDRYVKSDGSIDSYKLEDYNKDNIGPGRALLAVYNETKIEKYRKAADLLRKQLEGQPRTHEGGYWHKKIYPYQMWLDGLFMAEPFHGMYATMFNEAGAFDDITNQFIWIASHTRDPKTGLLYHAWDESKQQKWADPVTGCSPNFWGRAIGWYAMGLVDVLDFVPAEHPKRDSLLSIFRSLSKSLLDARDQKSAMWKLILDQGDREGNYLETSASCMFVYVFAKGANRGYLDKEYMKLAQETFSSIIEHEVTISGDNNINLNNIVGAVGLGGDPYRDGSFGYYTSVPKIMNDKRGVGAFLLAAIEIEKGKKL